MCQFKSGLWTKNGLAWSLDTDSHEELIKEKGFKDDGVKTQFVRVEYIPEKFEDFLKQRKKYKNWKVRIDQDILPEWFQGETDTKAIEKAFKGIIGEVIDKRFIVGKVAEIKEGKNYYIYGSAQVKNICGSAQVEYIYGSAQVENICGSAQVKNICGSAQVENICDSAQVKHIYDSAQVEYIYDSAQVYNGNIKLIRSIKDNAIVIDRNNGIVIHVANKDIKLKIKEAE